MDLRKIETQEQFEDFYAEKHLETDIQKVEYLSKVLKLRAFRSDVPYTEKEKLICLEEQILSHLWEEPVNEC